MAKPVPVKQVPSISSVNPSPVVLNDGDTTIIPVEIRTNVKNVIGTHIIAASQLGSGSYVPGTIVPVEDFKEMIIEIGVTGLAGTGTPNLSVLFEGFDIKNTLFYPLPIPANAVTNVTANPMVIAMPATPFTGVLARYIMPQNFGDWIRVSFKLDANTYTGGAAIYAMIKLKR